MFFLIKPIDLTLNLRCEFKINKSPANQNAQLDIRDNGSSVGEWFGRSLAVLGVDGSSLHTASQSCDDLNSPYV